MEGRSEYVIDKDELWYKNTTGRTYHKHNRERALLSLKIQRTGSSDDLVMTRLRGCVKLRALEQSLLPANTKFFKDFLSTKTHLTRLVFLSRTDVWFCYSTYFLYTDRNIWRNHAPGSPSDANNVRWCMNTPVWFSETNQCAEERAGTQCIQTGPVSCQTLKCFRLGSSVQGGRNRAKAASS